MRRFIKTHADYFLLAATALAGMIYSIVKSNNVGSSAAEGNWTILAVICFVVLVMALTRIRRRYLRIQRREQRRHSTVVTHAHRASRQLSKDELAVFAERCGMPTEVCEDFPLRDDYFPIPKTPHSWPA